MARRRDHWTGGRSSALFLRVHDGSQTQHFDPKTDQANVNIWGTIDVSGIP